MVRLAPAIRTSHPLAVVHSRQRIGMSDIAEHLQIVLSDPTEFSKGRIFGVLSPRTCSVNTQDAKHGLIIAGVG